MLIDPFLVHSLGFGLSCGASAGILLLAGPLRPAPPGPRLDSGAAGGDHRSADRRGADRPAGVRHLPLAALPANLAAAPAAAALSLWGLGSGVLGGLLGLAGRRAWPGGVLQVPTALLAGWIRAVARLAARSSAPF